MRRAARGARARLLREERGISLPELIITMTLLLLVAGALLTVVESLSTSLGRQQVRSEINDEARLAVQRLDREIRSGNVLYDPGLEDPPYYSMRIYTQANATTRDPAFQCVQWKLEDRRLLRRWWPPYQPAEASGWSVLADHVVNQDLEEPAFDLNPDPSKAGRTVDITLALNGRLEQGDTPTVRIQTSLTGRNTSFGYPVQVCDPVPAG